MNDEELAAMDALDAATRRLFALTPCYPSESDEMTLHIHALQTLVMSRAAVRKHPRRFTHYSSFCGGPRVGAGDLCVAGVVHK